MAAGLARIAEITRNARRTLINRTARIWSRLTRTFLNTAGRELAEWLDKIKPVILTGNVESIPDFPAGYLDALHELILNGLVFGYWLSRMQVQEVRKAHGCRLSNDAEVKASLARIVNHPIKLADSSDWHEVLPQDAINWIENYVPSLAGILREDILIKVRDVVRESLREGWALEQQMSKLEEVLRGMTQHRLETIARTELTRADTMGRLIQYAECADVDGVEFSAILDSRTTEICKQRNGLVMRLDDKRLPANTPPLHPNCRSMLLATTVYDHKGKLKTSPEFDEALESKQRDSDIQAVQIALGYLPFGRNTTANQKQKSPEPRDIITQITGVKQGEPMSIEEALDANPNYSKGREYRVNCQRCVQAYELRRRGYDVEALPRIVDGKNDPIKYGHECFTPKGTEYYEAFTFFQTEAAVKQELKSAPVGSRYIIYIKWKGRNNAAHVFIAEKTEANIVRYVDPQSGHSDVSSYFTYGRKGCFGYFRVDDKDFTDDAAIISATVKARGGAEK